jgi:hypothetical protein
MSEIQTARNIIRAMVLDLSRESVALPWFSMRRRSEINGAADALAKLHGRLCDIQMESILASARSAIRTPSTGEEQ